jgi:hypothetical protein
MLEDEESSRSSRMKKDDKVHRDIWFGQEGIQRLERLAYTCRSSQGEIARQALIEYEISRTQFRDTVRDAVLAVFRAQIPDELYDPVDDPRQEESVRHLGELLNSPYAAEGIAEAFSLLFAQNMLSMSSLHFPSVETPGAGSRDLGSEQDE